MNRNALFTCICLLAQGGVGSEPAGPVTEREPPAHLPLHALAVEDMPANWRPHGSVSESLDQSPWTATEAEAADAAVYKGLIEIVEFFNARPEQVYALGINSVESVVNAGYAAGNMPNLQRMAYINALRNLSMIVSRRLQRAHIPPSCAEHLKIVSYCNYMHLLYPPGLNPEKDRLIGLANDALASCNTTVDYDKLLAGPIEQGRVFNLLMRAIVFVEAQTVPGLDVPDNEKELPAAVWKFFESYPLEGARAYPDGARAKPFIRTAYLATHIGYLPTGYDRHPIYISDAPWLYRFLRENFYAVLESGNLDLISEFVDLFRQYGCTEKSDRQTRDGTRYLMQLYHAAGDSWIDFRLPEEVGKELSAYQLIHRPWTGIAAVRRRVPEPPVEGTYGWVFRTATGLPLAGEAP